MSEPQVDNPVIAHSNDLIRLRHHARDMVHFPKINARQMLAGSRRSSFRGRGMDYDEVRLYQPGDDVRAIDWRVTARTSEPYTKIFREEKERPVEVVTDLRNTMFFGSNRMKSVVACEIAALLAWAGLNSNDRVGGWVASPNHQQQVKARRSHHAVLQYIQALSDASERLIEPTTNTYSFAQLLEETRRTTLPGTSVFIISDFQDFTEGSHKALFELRRHSDVTFIQVYDPLEKELPPPGEYKVGTGDETYLMNTSDKTFVDRYSRLHGGIKHKLETVAKMIGSPFMTISTDQNVTHLLRQVYGKNSARRSTSVGGNR